MLPEPSDVNWSPMMMLEGRPPSKFLLRFSSSFPHANATICAATFAQSFCWLVLSSITTSVPIWLFLESYELKRYNISSLMEQLIEGMLSVGSRLSEDNRSGHIINRLTKAVHGFSVRFHIQLLQMCRETAQCLRIRKNGCCLDIRVYFSHIHRSVHPASPDSLRIFSLMDSLSSAAASVKELCKYFRSECQGQDCSANCRCR